MSALIRAARPLDFDRLYRKHAPTVYRYAYAVLGNQADAEDVTQQTFLNAYRAIEQGTKPRKAENWLITIAHNEVRRHFRKNGGPIEVEFDDQVGDGGLEPSPVEPSLADVLRVLRKLPPTQRSALVMREFEGRSYAEIAEILEVTQSALEALLFRARRGLAAELEEALTCTDAERAISRRLDGRLARRESRRLKEHLHECRRCISFATLQKRQRSLLKGLSIMPIPASLFLFRGEHAAAAGLGGSAAAAAGTGVGVTVVAKTAAVTAAVAVTGGVGYGVATNPPKAAEAAPKSAKSAPQVVRAAAPVAARRTSSRNATPVAARPARAEVALPVTAAKKKKLKLRQFRLPPARSRSKDRVVKPEKPPKTKLQARNERPKAPSSRRPERKQAKEQTRPARPGRAKEKARSPKAEQAPPQQPPQAAEPAKKPKP